MSDCTYHKICGLPDDVDPEAQLCILHSHKPDKDEKSKEKLLRINRWFAGELAYLAKRLAETPEPGGDGCMLDNTQIVWLNELGKGNSHMLENIPFVLIGGGPGRHQPDGDFAKKFARVANI